MALFSELRNNHPLHMITEKGSNEKQKSFCKLCSPLLLNLCNLRGGSEAEAEGAEAGGAAEAGAASPILNGWGLPIVLATCAADAITLTSRTITTRLKTSKSDISFKNGIKESLNITIKT